MVLAFHFVGGMFRQTPSLLFSSVPLPYSQDELRINTSNPAADWHPTIFYRRQGLYWRSYNSPAFPIVTLIVQGELGELRHALRLLLSSLPCSDSYVIGCRVVRSGAGKLGYYGGTQTLATVAYKRFEYSNYANLTWGQKWHHSLNIGEI